LPSLLRINIAFSLKEKETTLQILYPHFLFAERFFIRGNKKIFLPFVSEREGNYFIKKKMIKIFKKKKKKNVTLIFI
jgi:hypothetical protein